MGSIWTMGELLVEMMRPRAGMPLGEPGEFLGPYPSGAPAIFADTVARLGKRAGIIGGVGDDDFGKCLLRRLERDGVDCRFVLRDGTGSTGVAFVAYDESGERQFLYHIGGTPATRQTSPALEGIASPAWFHLMGCSLAADKGFREEMIRTIPKFMECGAKLSFDPNLRPELLRGGSLDQLLAPVLPHCSVLLPGVEELLAISGERRLETGVEKLLENPVLEVIALKMGSQGSRVYTRDGQWETGVYPVEVRDPTGAGDCFDAAFLCGLVDGLPLEQCLGQAAAAGALNVAAFGPMEGKISPAAIQELLIRGCGG